MIDTTKALADYADAILSGRRAKNWLFLILLVTLVTQLTLFFVARYTNFLVPGAVTVSSSTTQPAPDIVDKSRELIRYLVAMVAYAGLIGSMLMSVVLLTLTIIMLTVRTLGVGKLTSAFIWSVVLAVMMFPWQAILAGPAVRQGGDAIRADFKVPGVIYTWTEFDHPTLGARFEFPTLSHPGFLRWARFVGFPVVALIILLAIQVKSGKGVRAALGEDQPPADAGAEA